MFKSSRLKRVASTFRGSKAGSVTSESKAPDSKVSSVKKGLSLYSKVQSGISSGSADLTAQLAGYSGIKGKIIAVAFDFTQSLLAVSTDNNEVHVFGQNQVEVTFTFTTKSPINRLHFVKGIYLVIIDAKDTLSVISLYSKEILATIFIPSRVTCVEVDPALDWILLGLQSGSVMIYDVDRNIMSPTKIENLQKSLFFPKEPLSPVVSLKWNPRDLGTILISYNHVTVTFSFIEMKVKQSFVYESPSYTPNPNIPSKEADRRKHPKVTQSLYHPNSLNILTVHEDNSMVFWDSNTGRMILARSLLETDLNLSEPDSSSPLASGGGPTIARVMWLCEHNPEKTYLLVVTNSISGNDNNQGITILDLGNTPMYSLTSYEGMSKYYSNPQRQRLSPIVEKSRVVDIVPIPRSSPYFSGCHDPAFILVVLEDGEIETLLVQSGNFTSKGSLLPQNLSWARPIVSVASAFAVPEKLWLGLMGHASGEGLLKGGKPLKRPLTRRSLRTALVTGHVNGAVRIWDSNGKELDSNAVLEVNLSRTLNRSSDIAVADVSFAPETLELAVSSERGEVVLFKFEVNRFFNKSSNSTSRDLDLSFRRFSLSDIGEPLVDVRDRAPENIKQGFLPRTIVNMNEGKTTALKNSEIGFVGIAYESGALIVVDRRGPAIIYRDNIKNIPQMHGSTVSTINFSIMEYGTEGYSSILMFCGTDRGELIIFKILPAGNGRFTTQFVELTKTNDAAPIVNISTCSERSGSSCEATVSKMQDLSKGLSIPGYVIIAGQNDIRVIKPGVSKESRKSFKQVIASAGCVNLSRTNSKGEVSQVMHVVALSIDSTIRILSIPNLKEVRSMHSPVLMLSHFINQSSVLPNGEIFARSELYYSVILSVASSSASDKVSTNVSGSDTLYNPNLKIAYRPQVNTLQWARGTVYCSPEQLDLILGGENRPPSKYEESAIAKGTLAIKQPQENPNEEFQYKKPTKRMSRSTSYNVFRDVSRVVENKWDELEDQFNDYATAMGQGMNDIVEQAGKDLMKGSLGI